MAMTLFGQSDCS